MSFGGGGREQYTLEYIVKVVNQGGGSALNQINQGFTKTGQTAQQATVSTEKLRAASNRLSQANMGMTKAMKSTAFGMFGITTAGAEMFGMLSMLQQVQLAQKEALEEQSQALKEGGKESKAYKDATMEVVKVNRWASMTQRNFMLSIFDMVPFTIMATHGITKMVTAAKEVKAAKAAADNLKLLGFNAGGVAAQMLRAGTSIGGFTPQISKFSKATTIATTGTFKLGAETVKNTKFFGAGEAALISNAVAMGKAEKAATGASKAMRVLSIAMKVAIPLIALEVASQAFANNWGGFRDKINEVGVAIGNTIPALKGMLGWIDKIGRSIVAIFTGDIGSIKSIWNPIVEGADKAKEMTDKERKAIEELRESVLDYNASAMDTFGEAAMGDKGERRDFMKSMGLDKDARKDLDNVLDDFEEIENAALGLHNALDTMRTLNLMRKFGLDVPNQSWKDIAKGLSDVFEDLGDRFPGDDMFDQFAEAMEEASKKKGPAVIKAIMAFMDDNPNFLPFLTAHSPEIAKNITTMLNEAGYKVDASGLVTGVNTAVQNAFKSGSILDPNAGETKNMFFGSKKLEGGTTTGGGGGGLLDNIITTLQSEVKGLPAKIQAMDWNAVGQKIGDKFVELFGTGSDTAVKVGAWINDNVIMPAEGVMRGMGARLAVAAAPWVQQFRKDPIGALFGKGGLTQPVGDFVAGLLGFASEDTMFTFFQIKLKVAADKFAQYFRDYFHNQEITKFDEGSGGMDIGQGEGFKNWTDQIVTAIQNAYANLIITLNNDPNVQQFRKWFHDPIGALIQLIKTLGNVAEKVNTKAEQAGIKTSWTWQDIMDDFGITGFLENVKTEYDKVVTKVTEDQNVTKLKTFIDTIKKGGQMALDFIWNLGKTQTAEGAGTSDELINAAGGFNAAEASIKFQLPTVEVLAGKYIMGGGIQGGTNSTPIIEGPNGITPTFTTQNAIIQPVSATADISGSIKTVSDSGGPGKEGTGHPGSWGSAYAIYIDYPGTVGIKPQSVAFDISESDVAVGVTTFQAIAVEADKTKQFIVNAYNELAATLAELFSTISGLWSDTAAEIGQNAADSGQAIYNELNQGLENAAGVMNNLAKHWSKMCNSMIKNAQSAANGITKAMNSIPDTESVHTIRVRRVYEFAEGGEMTGVISAAGGKILTTHGEQMFKIGDNPGGQESIWAIPHNRPGPIVEQINDMYGNSTGIRRSGVISSQPIEIHTHNHYLERDVETIKRIENNRLVSRFGG